MYTYNFFSFSPSVRVLLCVTSFTKIKASMSCFFTIKQIYAEVVTFVAGSLEAGGLPGSLEISEVLK